MKILRLFTVFAIVTSMISCATGKSTQTAQQPSQSQNQFNIPSSAYAAGVACGNALLALHNQYKAEGKIDLTDPNCIIHLATLAGSSAYLKANSKDKAYYQDFAKGTISGSRNIITASLTNKVLSSLSKIDLSSLNQKAAAASQTAKAVSSVVNLLKIMKQ